MEVMITSPIDKGLLEAQGKAKQLLSEIEKRNLIVTGASESEITEQIFELAFELYGTKKHWHKRIVRAGANTIFTFSGNPADRILADGDLVYLDLGPVFDEFEADIGKTYLLGKDPDKERLIRDLESIFKTAKEFYLNKLDMTGADLWSKVIELTEAAGWKFGNTMAGHIISDFSHSQKYGSLPENRISAANNLPMNRVASDGRQHHWILEVHLVHPNNTYGGFFEDLLSLE